MGAEQDAAALAAAIRDAAGQLIRRVRQESGTTLTWSQSALLSGLARHGQATASELAADNGLRPQTVWSSLITLEQRGLVTRERDATDRRNVHVSLTDKGRAELAADRTARENWIARVLEDEFTSEERARIAGAVPLIVRLARFEEPQQESPAAF
ncbi:MULTISPECIES: MarR family transcriptional regulator [unclassified Streptomyces]|uniref:MarR family winged helix-turn-helix transcriptional regulator n=1 Tax=unclassified Streptomyces TaxID=2593676 RepID=UPI00081D6238|nr:MULTISPECIES: MarR family transcriptional regulator [unclassified Streptomyces]MYZ34445.1 MarR family transcriptional regulator [Streptomyces sp. SID4917]SCF67418.1 DNA-binding transcriptional regulator, MarR family [Streptomyces sp. MnatMP-M17]